MEQKSELEKWYSKKDPWEYEKTVDDVLRKDIILSKITGKYLRALDIGCGEGWITKDLPAKEIYGIELSDNAAKRFPKNVKRIIKPEGKYDLIIATGVLYQHYDHQTFIQWIKDHASGLVLLCNIKEWEVPLDLPNEQENVEFPYREFTQKLRIYDFTA